MIFRLRTLVIVCGSVAAIGAAWPALVASSGPGDPAVAMLTVAEPPSNGHHDDSHDDPGAGHDDPQEDGRSRENSADHGGGHGASPARTPSKPKAGEGKQGSGKSGEAAPRKPLFGDKGAEKKAAGQPEPEGSITADRALELLKEGNQRWASGDARNPSSDSDRRRTTADKGQEPFVTILTCADSRVPVERVFDRGVGEMFTVRVAGNVAATAETATIEYGVEHLHTPLLVVMGHTKCGAVAAAASGEPLHGNLGELVSSIVPAVERVRKSQPGADPQALAAASVKENVWQSIFDLYRSSEELRTMTRDGKLKVVGAVYDIASGKVEWLGEHPWQSQILDALQIKSASAPTDHE